MKVLSDFIVALFVPQVEHVPDPRTIMLARWAWRARKKRHRKQLRKRLKRYARTLDRRWAAPAAVVRFDREFRP